MLGLWKWLQGNQYTWLLLFWQQAINSNSRIQMCRDRMRLTEAPEAVCVCSCTWIQQPRQMTLMTIIKTFCNWKVLPFLTPSSLLGPARSRLGSARKDRINSRIFKSMDATGMKQGIQWEGKYLYLIYLLGFHCIVKNLYFNINVTKI